MCMGCVYILVYVRVCMSAYGGVDVSVWVLMRTCLYLWWTHHLEVISTCLNLPLTYSPVIDYRVLYFIVFNQDQLFSMLSRRLAPYKKLLCLCVCVCDYGRNPQLRSYSNQTHCPITHVRDSAPLRHWMLQAKTHENHRCYPEIIKKTLFSVKQRTECMHMLDHASLIAIVVDK